MALDLGLFTFLNSAVGVSPFLDRLILFCAAHLPYFLIGIFLVWLAFFILPGAPKLEVAVAAFASALLARGVIVEAIRFFYDRPRPFSVMEVNQLLTNSPGSFPSGHAALFFALSTAVYLYDRKWGIGFFIASALVSLTRVMSGIHWPSDILGGALIGIGSALLVAKLANRHFIPEHTRPLDK